MKFCSVCGSDQIIVTKPEGDNSERQVCASCGYIFYENPKIVVACIAEWDGGILMCRRGIEPGIGMWTIPGGFMENNESIRDAALRETLEESCAKVAKPELFAVYNLLYNQQVYVIYRGQLIDGKCASGHETTEVKIVDKDKIPWDEIAFSVVKEALELYLEDSKQGHFQVHQGDMPTRGQPALRY